MSTFRSAFSSVKYHTVTRPAIVLVKHAGEAVHQKLKKWVHDKKVGKQGRKVGLRSSIMGKTRGALANNPRALQKSSLAGQKRRAQLAKTARSQPRPTRKYSVKAPSKPTAAPSAPKPNIRGKVLKATRGPLAANTRAFNKGTLAGQKRRQAAANRAKSFPRPVRKHGVKTASVPKAKPMPKAPHGSVQAAINTSKTHGQLRRKLTGQAVRKVSSSLKGSRTQRAAALRNFRKEHPEKLKNKVRLWKVKHQKEAASILASKKP